MSPSLLRASFAWASLLLLLLRADADPPAVRRGIDTLEDLVGQLVRVQKAVHTAKTEWQDQEAQLKREEELLRHRVAAAGAKLKEIEAEATRAKQQQGRDTAAATAAEAALARHYPPILAAEKRLVALRHRLPPLLTEALAKEFDRLPGEGEPVTPENVAGRLRLVLSLTTEIEQYDAQIHTGTLILQPPDGVCREMEILQLGLGIAFAVSSDDSQAAVGQPGTETWQWRWEDGLGKSIHTALEVYRKKRPAEFANLPLELGGNAP